jgi:methionyl-tRNA formyltransferase
MRLIFMGTPDFAATALATLLDAGHEVACVYSQPPRPAGRGLKDKPSPVHQLALGKGIEVRTPASLKSQKEQQRFAELKADAAVVVAYGLILPNAVLSAPRFGCFNIHASLLPRWRGAAPIQRAIMAGDAETGITIMRMDEGLDTGHMMKRVSCPITDKTTASSLHDELAELGAAAMLEVLKQPDATGEPQPTVGVTYAAKISKAEAQIDFSEPARFVLRHIHGLSPFPGAWFEINGTRIKALRCEIAQGRDKPGTALDNQLTIACGEGVVRLLEVQREGKGPMETDAFLRGFAIPAGTKIS